MDPFATLGLARRYDLDPVELERHYRELQKALHPDRHMGAAASARRAALGKAVEVNEAYGVLRDPVKRAEALLGLLAAGAPPVAGPADPQLLMEVMELREALSDARHSGDAVRVRALADSVQSLEAHTRGELVTAFAAVTRPVTAETLRAMGALVARLKYYQRFLDEVRAIDDETQA